MAPPPRSKQNKPDTTAPFKSAMGAAVRAIGGKRELEVSFSADRPILTADKARLANLPRLPTLRDILSELRKREYIRKTVVLSD